MADLTPDLERAHRTLSGATGIVALTGAGVSTDSGIPDFRGPDGVWTRDPEAEKHSTIDHYLASPDIRRVAWRRRAENPAWQARPNAGHLALAGLEREGRLDLLVTQNIDGLHLAAGNSRDRVVEVHGTMREVECVQCGWRGPTPEVFERLDSGEEDPECRVCGGILKTAVVFFGEALDERDLHRAFDAAASAEVLLCVGTSLLVFPVARMVPIALSQGAQVVIVNGEPTPFDDEAVVVRGSISEVLPELLRS